MERLYKFLKVLIIVLFVAVVAVGGLKLFNSTKTEAPDETTVETTEAPKNLAPDFTVYDIDGNAYKLSDFRGMPVILNFWASWCGPCKAEMPDFEEAYLEYGDKIHFVIVNLTDGRQETVESASEYISQQGYTFPVFYDTDMEAAYTYSITSIPRTYFIDADGNMVYAVTQMISADELQQGIDLLLGGE